MTDNVRDAWHELRRHTQARIALGRAGVSQCTADHLAFQLDHAAARDAVWAALDVPLLLAALSASGLDAMELQSRAPDRSTYLLRPDLGRQLSEASADLLQARCSGVSSFDVALVIADGLSARSVQHQSVPVVAALRQRMLQRGWSVAPVSVVRQGRVAIGDGIGGLLGARLSIFLVGERPGLSSAASMGAYLTWNPRLGRTDAERNCVSNIHPGGLSVQAGIEAIWHLASESLRRMLTGVGLKDERVLSTASCLQAGSAAVMASTGVSGDGAQVS
jgi:ethanolamine ammonia-lyase small subunit